MEGNQGVMIDSRIQELLAEFDSKPNKASALPCEFYKKPTLNKKRTAEEGYPVYETEIYARIRVDPYTLIDQPILICDPEGERKNLSKYTIDVEKRDKDFTVIWAENWKRFLAGQTDQVIGFRLDVFFVNDPGKAETYKHLGILTLEQLAIAPESTIRMIPTGLTDREMANRYLEKMQQAKPMNESHQLVESLKQQLEIEKEKNENMREQMNTLTSKLDLFLSGQSEGAPKRKPGRPRKIKIEGEKNEDFE